MEAVLIPSMIFFIAGYVFQKMEGADLIRAPKLYRCLCLLPRKDDRLSVWPTITQLFAYFLPASLFVINGLTDSALHRAIAFGVTWFLFIVAVPLLWRILP